MAFRPLQPTIQVGGVSAQLATAAEQPTEEQPKDSLAKKVGKFAYEASGAKSMMDVGALPAKAAIETPRAIEMSKALSENRKALADYTTQLIKMVREEEDPERKEKLNKIINNNFNIMGKVLEEEKTEEEAMLTQKEILGTTAEAGLTAAIYGGVGAGTAGLGAKTALAQKAAAGAAIAPSFYAAHQLKEGEEITKGGIVTSAIIGAAAPIAIEGAKVAARFFGGILKRAGGLLTGKGKEVIETIIERPLAAREGMRGESSEVLEGMGRDVRTAVQGLKKEAQKKYADALEKLPTKAPVGTQWGAKKTTVLVGEGAESELIELSTQGVKSKLTTILREFGVIVDSKKKTFDFLKSPFRKSEENTLKEIFSIIQTWDDATPKGLNSLAIKIGNYVKRGEQSNAFNSVISAMKKNVRNYVGEKIPEIATMNATYAAEMDFIDAVSQELSVKGAFSGMSGVIKTAKKIDTLFGANKELVRKLISDLEKLTSIEVLGKAAGKEITEIPKTAVSMGSLVQGLIQTAIPPKVIGELAARVGIAQIKMQPLVNGLQKLAPAQRVAFFNFIAQLSPELTKKSENQ